MGDQSTSVFQQSSSKLMMMNLLQRVLCLFILVTLVNTKPGFFSRTKRSMLSNCETATLRCCNSMEDTFIQSGRCFELNDCPGINFVRNPCQHLINVINKL